MGVEIQSKWTCDCLCGCKKIELGEVSAFHYYGDEPETEANQPRKGWAEMPDSVMCPECWDNIGKTGCTTIKGGIT